MKDNTQKNYEGDVESYSRDSLRFYKKINLDCYKHLYAKNEKEETDTSNANSKGSAHDFNFQKDMNNQRTLEDTSVDAKDRETELLNYPLQAHFKNRALSMQEDE